MRFLSLFSGIEAASVAWKPLGWECVGLSEIEPFPCKLLAHHYPDAPNLGDITKITKEQIKQLGKIDVVIFGSPCQDLSVAGKRKGFINEDGSTTRSGLFYDAMRIVKWSGARFALWENVPGAFSSNEGRDFAEVVGEMAGISDVDVPKNKWGNEGVALGGNGLLEWSILDAQFRGLAQRRKRVFAVLDTGNWSDRPPILLEPEGLRGDTPPSREARKDATATTTGGTCSGKPVFGTLMANCGTKQWLGNQEALSGDYHVFALAGNIIGRKPENGGNGTGYDKSGVSYTLTKTDQHAVAYSGHIDYENNNYEMDKPANLLMKGLATSVSRPLPAIVTQMQVRRLTPTECERLQGFPDGYTNIPDASDAWRYKSLGNSMAVPVIQYIGKQIQKANSYRGEM